MSIPPMVVVLCVVLTANVIMATNTSSVNGKLNAVKPRVFRVLALPFEVVLSSLTF